MEDLFQGIAERIFQGWSWNMRRRNICGRTISQVSPWKTYYRVSPNKQYSRASPWTLLPERVVVRRELQNIPNKTNIIQFYSSLNH